MWSIYLRGYVHILVFQQLSSYILTHPWAPPTDNTTLPTSVFYKVNTFGTDVLLRGAGYFAAHRDYNEFFLPSIYKWLPGKAEHSAYCKKYKMVWRFITGNDRIRFEGDQARLDECDNTWPGPWKMSKTLEQVEEEREFRERGTVWTKVWEDHRTCSRSRMQPSEGRSVGYGSGGTPSHQGRESQST